MNILNLEGRVRLFPASLLFQLHHFINLIGAGQMVAGGHICVNSDSSEQSYTVSTSSNEKRG